MCSNHKTETRRLGAAVIAAIGRQDRQASGWLPVVGLVKSDCSAPDVTLPQHQARGSAATGIYSAAQKHLDPPKENPTRQPIAPTNPFLHPNSSRLLLPP
ncbi:hypothetical protein VTJ04DRAFT_7252 [Mycothermus thermophilus]|uniref:uncharacterized protein n=1 Tax=Humicola insolens TaxID=85995 RepID=UPI003742E536